MRPGTAMPVADSGEERALIQRSDRREKLRSRNAWAAFPLADLAMTVQPQINCIVESKEAAESVGLTYASVDERGIERRRSGKGFNYRDCRNRTITDPQILSRIRKLVIPPAWRSVWICPDPEGHIQAFGYDEKGRKQYRYHPKFREVRESIKFEHMMVFAGALPRLRQ